MRICLTPSGEFGLSSDRFWCLGGALSSGFWCQTLWSVDEVWVKQDYANLSDTERRVWVGRIERICLTPSREFE